MNMDVLKNRGGPLKSSILIGFCIINHPFWGIPIFENTHIEVSIVCLEIFGRGERQKKELCVQVLEVQNMSRTCQALLQLFFVLRFKITKVLFSLVRLEVARLLR